MATVIGSESSGYRPLIACGHVVQLSLRLPFRGPNRISLDQPRTGDVLSTDIRNSYRMHNCEIVASGDEHSRAKSCA